MSERGQTRKAFDAQIRDLEQELLKMATFVEQMVADALRALEKQDVSLADEVIRRDDMADQMDIDIEQRCIRLLALQQPMSRDLRTIATALKIIADLERIGDFSVDIARAVAPLAVEPYFKPLVDIPRMAEFTKKMVRDALTAFVRRDLQLVRQVCADDDVVDRMWYSLRDELMDSMRKDSSLVTQATHLLLVARYLERIADHATNVAERVDYMETGTLKQLARAHTAEGLGRS